MSAISRSIRTASSAMIASSRRCCSGFSMRRSVSIALRTLVSGLRSSCATSAAKRSLVSIRAQRSRAARCRSRARMPISSSRARRAGGTLPVRPSPWRIAAALPASCMIGLAKVCAR